jgi:thymidylate synthase (FAD)
MSKVNLVWATPDAEKLVAYMARVSNPSATLEDDSSKLINYLIKHKHWSPFEMVSACVEINTTRDITRQILRHRSFSFQEFSQRYAEAQGFEKSECRLQDTKNRQNSFVTTDTELQQAWDKIQQNIITTAEAHYQIALGLGIAKEQARKLLPEGLTTSKMYMTGTLRSWMHYLDIRTGVETQKEHREVAEAIKAELLPVFPTVLTREA